MDYQVRTASQEDLQKIQEIYASARAFMAGSRNETQWGTTNPPLYKLQEDLQKQRLDVLFNESGIHGVFMFEKGEDPTYRVIEKGSWHSDRPYGVIHRVAGDGSGGILKAAVEFAEQQADYLRMDTHENNHPMQKALFNRGFTYCGIIYLENGDPRLAYDRMKTF